MTKISSHSVIETDDIGNEAIIDEFSVIRKGATIGRNVHIFPHVFVNEGVVIGDNVRIYPGSFVGKTPDGAGAISRQPNFKKFIRIGNNSAIGPNATIYYDVEIGEETLIGDGVSIRENGKIGNLCVIGRYVTVNYNVVVGDRTKIMDHSWMAGNMIIGSDVFIGGGVLTTNDNSMEKRIYDPNTVIGPRLNDYCSIGSGTVILPGIIIGLSSIVGAGAVVTKDVPENTLVMGVPATIKRYLTKD